MPLETAQLLCTALRLNNCDKAIYRATHKNHPCAVWARESRDNFVWLCNFGVSLCKEYSLRYNKKHKCENVINHCLSLKDYIPAGFKTKFRLAMPDIYKRDCPIESYRLYYINEKQHIAKWTNREKPSWYQS